MDLFKVMPEHLQQLSQDKLSYLSSEAEFVSGSLCLGVSGIGELLQVVDVDSVSDDAIRNVGGLLVIMAKIMNESLELQSAINRYTN